MRTTNYLMEKYLDSTITYDEKAILNERMLSDPSLVKELAFRQELNLLAIEDDVSELRKKLNLASRLNENTQSTRFISSRTKRVFYAAATVTGIALGSWALLTGGEHQVKPDMLYHENFMPYPPVTVFRESHRAEFERGFFYAMKLYQESRFAEAAKDLELLLEMDPNSATIKFYLGVSYMQLEDYVKSHMLFDQIINGDSFFAEQALWYKGLSYLAQKETQKAKETFEGLIMNDNPYTTKAKKIIKKLDK